MQGSPLPDNAREGTIQLEPSGKTVVCNRGDTVLSALEREGYALPNNCRAGACGECKTKLLDGEVDQSEGVALNGRQINDGYVLLCVARPRSDCTLDVGVESHDKLYRNPFQSPLGPDELKAGVRTGLKSNEDMR